MRALTITAAYVLEPFGPTDPLTLRVEFSNKQTREFLLRAADGSTPDMEDFGRLCMATGLLQISDTRELVGRKIIGPVAMLN